MTDPHTITLPFTDNDLARQLFGEHNAHLQRLAEILDVRINTRGTTLFVEGERPLAELAENLLNQLYGLLREGYPLHPNDIEYAARMLSGNERLNLKDIFLDTVYVTAKKSVVTPKSPAQKAYIDAIRTNDIVFGIGPAGTGKTYLAMAMAVAAYTKGQVSRIILTRPAVEAGETLGFLPGDLAGKGGPLPEAPLRRAARHDALRKGLQPHGEGGHRGRSHRVHARSHAQRRLHHPGRGPEHDLRADENVPDAHRVRFEGRDHRATSPRSTCRASAPRG